MSQQTYTLCCPACGDMVFEVADAGSWEATRHTVPSVLRCTCGFAATEQGQRTLFDCLQDMLSIDADSWIEHDGISHPTRRRDPEKYPPPTRPWIFTLKPGKGPPTA